MHRIIALAALAGMTACTSQDPRIVASFRQGEATYNYATPLGRAYYYYASPTVVGDRVYIGTSRRFHDAPGPDNYFFALDRDLRKVWELPLGEDEVRGGAAVDSAGRIYFVVERGRRQSDATAVTDLLTAVSPEGRILWQFDITSRAWWVRSDVGMFNPAIAADGTIYAAGAKLFALDASGALKWAYGSGGPDPFDSKSGPVVDPAGNVYFVALGQLHSVRPDGTLRWRASGGWGDAWSSPAFSFDHARVYFAIGQALTCVDTATGAVLWSYVPPDVGGGDFRASPAVDDAGNVYVGTKADRNGRFYAIRADGTLMWVNELGADLYSSPALGDDRTIYVGSEYTGSPRRFHALDMVTGARKWSVELPGMGDVTWSSPAIVEGGVIYVGSMNGNVYAIRSDATGYLPGAGSPRFRGGNDGTGRRP